MSATLLYGNIRCRSLKELSSSACSCDRQTGHPGGVELATLSLSKESSEDQNSLKSLGRAARQLASLALLLPKGVAGISAIWPALLTDLTSTKCFDVIFVILRNVIEPSFYRKRPHNGNGSESCKSRNANWEKNLNLCYTNYNSLIPKHHKKGMELSLWSAQ